ncbi:MAG: SprT-like domain-containing protein [Magnetococcales bacterium]|nr:SprT-like domain-containing protein [Magnetococcales bacterium]
MDRPSIKQAFSYQAAFDYFNKKLFEGKLPPVILNFSRSGAKTAAFFAPGRWENGNQKKNERKEVLDEISLNPKWLGRTEEEVFSSLVHEMVHHWQFAFKTPPRKAYHNKEWAEKMLEVGLRPDNGRGGMTGTKVGHHIETDGAFQKAFAKLPQSYRLPWRVFIEGFVEPPKQPRKSGKRTKYTCPGCGLNIWGKEDLAVICKDCDLEYQAHV